MVSEHNRRSFPAPLLSATFGWATFGNGLVAIVSGLVATIAVDYAQSEVNGAGQVTLVHVLMTVLQTLVCPFLPGQCVVSANDNRGGGHMGRELWSATGQGRRGSGHNAETSSQRSCERCSPATCGFGAVAV